MSKEDAEFMLRYNIENNCMFRITLDEAKALNFFLKLHSSLLKEHPDEYEQLLRLINGLSQFIDSNEVKK